MSWPDAFLIAVSVVSFMLTLADHGVSSLNAPYEVR